MFWRFDELFSKRLQEVAQFVKKHEKSSIWSKLCNFSNKLPCLCISMNFSGKSYKKGLISWKSTKNHRFGQNFATFRTNYHVFAFRWTFQEKVAKSASFREKARKTIDLAKTCIFWSKLPCFGIFMNFSARSCKKCLISWKSTRNHRFGQDYATFRKNYHVFAFRWTFKQKVGKSGSFREKARNIMDLVKTCNFLKTLPCFDVSMNFSAKSCKNRLISLKSTKTHRFGQNYATFRTNYHVFAFRWTFQEKVTKRASFREKERKIIDLAKTLQLFEQTTMSLHFDELFRKKLQKVPHFVKKNEKSSIWPKLCNFSNKLPCLCISELFRKKLQKVRHFVKKHEKPSIWPKLASFGANYHVLAFSWTFQQEVAKSAISWKSTRNHRFGQNYASFRTNYHVFAFRWTFKEKVGKSGSFREKARKIMDLVKTCNFLKTLPCFDVSMNFSAKSCKNRLISWKSTKTHRFGQNYATSSNKVPCFGVWMNFSAKGCKKRLISWKSTKKHRFGQNFATFRTNYHVFAFRWTFQEKVTKRASFREKERKIIDLAKTLQLFEQTTMSLHFDELFRKKLQKVRHFVKKHEKPSIWPKLASFRANYHVLAFSWTFQQEVAKSASFREKAREIIDLAKTMQLFGQTTMFLHFDELLRKRLGKVVHFVKKHEKSWIWSKLATFSKHYHVLTFRWTFQQKVAKAASFREKARKIIDLAKTLQLFEQTTMPLHFDQLFRKKLQKVRHFVKKHEKPSIWPKLASFGANYHVLAFSWTFQQEVAKSASFREKAREIIDLTKTMQLFEQTTMFLHFDELLRKKLGKVVHFVKKHEISWIWSKLATFWKHYHVLTFRWTFQQKVAKVPHFVKKHEKSSIWPKLCNFSNKLPCLCISMNFSGKSCKKCVISWKSTKNHRFGQNLHLLEQTTMFWHFHELFSKKLQKVPHFVKKHEKSSIWPKLCNFSNKLPCFCISMNF